MKMVLRVKRGEKEACAHLADTDGSVTTALSAQSAMSVQAMEQPVCPVGDPTEIQDSQYPLVLRSSGDGICLCEGYMKSSFDFDLQ